MRTRHARASTASAARTKHADGIRRMMAPSTRSGPRRNRYSDSTRRSRLTASPAGAGTHHVHRQRTTQPKPAAASAAATWWHTGDGVTVIRDGATPEGTLPTGDRPRGRARIGH